jgi:hypothetical protein
VILAGLAGERARMSVAEMLPGAFSAAELPEGA